MLSVHRDRLLCLSVLVSNTVGVLGSLAVCSFLHFLGFFVFSEHWGFTSEKIHYLLFIIFFTYFNHDMFIEMLNIHVPIILI